MLIAGEASGDMLAAELVRALREEFAKKAVNPTADLQPLETNLGPQFFGAGGPRMAAEGVELAIDMTQHSVIGLSDALKNLLGFRRLFHQLFKLALERQPDAIICVDFAGFNRRLAHALRRYVERRSDWFHDWAPKIIQYVSPQVWASREGRAYQLARDYDLLLSIFPFELEWYAKRVPKFRVEFVGHPMVERYGLDRASAERAGRDGGSLPTILLLPGSRPGELSRHLPILIDAARRIAVQRPAAFRMVLPHESLAAYAKPAQEQVPQLEVQIGGLEKALPTADLAIAKSGTITLECAFFGVPTVVFYKTSLITYLVARGVVKVKHLAMPNLLAKEELFPEFIQGAATPENIAHAALELLQDEARRSRVKTGLQRIVAGLGGRGASERAAKAIMSLMENPLSVVAK